MLKTYRAICFVDLFTATLFYSHPTKLLESTLLNINKEVKNLQTTLLLIQASEFGMIYLICRLIKIVYHIETGWINVKIINFEVAIVSFLNNIYIIPI